MKKLYVLLVFIIILVLSGCGGGAGSGSAGSGGSGTGSGTGSGGGPGGSGGGSGADAITVVSPFDEGDGNRENFVNAYMAYEAETGITVNDVSEASSEEWKAKVTSDFESGNEPDVLFYFTGADADKLVENGKVVSISDIRKEYPDYASNMKDSMMPVSTKDGRQYAVPVNGYWEGMFVNKKVLAACGLDVPGADYTWDRFLSDCETIREEGYTPIACSLAEIPHYWFEYCVFNNGNITTHLVLPESAGDARGKVWAAGLIDIKELYDRGFLPEDTLSAADSETNLLMTDNKAAFMIDGSWKVGWFQEKAEALDDFAVTYVPAKGERKATEIIGGLSMGYYITSKAWGDAGKREACVRFVEAMTTDSVVSSFGALSVTALKNGTNPPESADSLMISAMDMTKNCTGVVAAAQDVLVVAARGALFGDVARIAAGETLPGDAIDNCLAITE